MSKSKTLRELDQTDDYLGRLMEDWKKYTDEQLNQRPADGGWSALQVMHHLILAEGGSLSYVKKKLGTRPELNRAGLGSFFRSGMLRLFLTLPKKYAAPKVVGEDMLPQRSSFADAQSQWLSVRQDLRDFLMALPEDHFYMEIYKHPRAGRMSLLGMLRFFNTHLQRHAGQVERTLAEASK